APLRRNSLGVLKQNYWEEVRSMVRRRLFQMLGLFVVTCLLIGLQSRDAVSDSDLGQGFREEQGGWIFVHIKGKPYKRGYQYGFLVAPEVNDFITTLKVYLQQNTTKDWQFYRQAAAKIFLPKLNEEYLQELRGIADGVQAAGYQYDLIDIIT